MEVLKQAVILAGGKGTRLKERLDGRPKPLVLVDGIPLLQRQLESLASAGISQILVLVNHAADQISNFISAYEWGEVDIHCLNDGTPLGTAGATLRALDKLAEEFLVVYGDTLFDIDLDRFESFHLAHPESAATLLLHPNDHPYDSDIVEIGGNGEILHFHGYPHPSGSFLPNMVNAAMYIVRRPHLAEQDLQLNGVQDFAKDLFPDMLRRGKKLYGYVTPEYIKDIGTPERLDRAVADLQRGKVQGSSLRQPQRMIFLDRDGTINVPSGYISKEKDFNLLPGVADAIGKINKSSYKVCVITNQPVVARGECSLDGLRKIHNKMETELGAKGAYLDRIYFCPHHPDRGFPGEVAELKGDCLCRKPGLEMVRHAIADFNIDVNRSWFLGDTTVDLETARRAGIKSVLIRTGFNGMDGKFPLLYDYCFANLAQAVDFILTDFDRMCHQLSQYIFSNRNNEVILIGGRARSGKSTVAAVIKDLIVRQGADCKVVSTDNWIRSEAERSEGFWGRHDLDGMRSTLSVINDRRENININLPSYNPQKRISVNCSSVVTISCQTVVVIEGVTALALSDLIPSALRLNVVLEENVRKKRFFSYYEQMGRSEGSYKELYKSRCLDENQIIDELAIGSIEVSIR
jgi:histidinol-phosphate phosphatase family protein